MSQHSILLTTTGTLAIVPIDDLGKLPGFVHPVVDFDLIDEFRISDLITSSDLQSAVDNGYIILKDSFGFSITDIGAQVQTSLAVSVGGAPIANYASELDFYGISVSTGTTGCIKIGPADAGLQGPQGGIGPQGIVGAGVQGNIGQDGLQGNQGIIGVTGSVGAGFQGPQGNIGQDGLQGFQGNDGNAGLQGQQGLGDIGFQGFQGTNPGPQGPQGVTSTSLFLTKLTNTLVTDVNADTGIVFSGFNTTPLINDDSSVTVSSNKIDINTTGRYRFYFNIYMTAVSARTNVGYQFRINDSNTGRISASDYIRNNSGHNSASTNLQEIFDLTSGDKVEIWCLREAGAGVVTVPVGQSVFQIERIV